MDLAANPQATVTIDLESQTVRAADLEAHFDFDPTAKDRLLQGLDGIGVTLTTHDEVIASHEASRPTWLPTSVG
jgi:3-isopropylmalate/(R)-2-methylmalate dehydratase small subunit